MNSILVVLVCYVICICINICFLMMNVGIMRIKIFKIVVFSREMGFICFILLNKINKYKK